MTTLNQQYLQATVPGNHELYHSSNASYIDASIYNQYYFNPQNGPKDQLMTSTTTVRIAVATVESVFRMPIFARIDVAPANRAAPTA